MNFGRIVERELYVEFVLSGEINLTGLTAALKAAHDECGKRSRNGALVDLRHAAGTLTAAERSQLVEALAPGWNRALVIAIVLSNEQFLPTRFGQLAAQNRGLRTREFRTSEEAAAWLVSAFVAPPPDESFDLV